MVQDHQKPVETSHSPEQNERGYVVVTAVLGTLFSRSTYCPLRCNNTGAGVSCMTERRLRTPQRTTITHVSQLVVQRVSLRQWLPEYIQHVIWAAGESKGAEPSGASL